MSTSSDKKQTGFWGKLSGLTGGSQTLRTDKARLEAFLDAAQAEYCGFAADGSLAYSKNFCSLLEIDALAGLDDIQNALSPSDAAVLEGMFGRLHDSGIAFSVTVKTAQNGKTLKLSGRRGRDTGEQEQFDVLWIEDISETQAEQAQIIASCQEAEEERDRLQTALDQTPMPLWIRNSRTELTWCNRAYAGTIDCSPATVIAEQKELSLKPLRKSGTGKARTQPSILAQEALDSGQPVQATGHMIMAGQRRLVTVHEIPFSGSMTLGLVMDITREEELETEQKRYASANKELLEQLGSAIGIFDSQQKLEFYNSAFAQLWGLEEQYLNTRPKLGNIMEKLRESRRLPEQADFRKFKQSWLGMFTSLIEPHEDMLYLPNAKAVRMLAIPHPMGGLMMTFEDVTSRLELESSYNTLIAVQKETLDNLSEGVVVFGGDGRLKLWNPAFAGLWDLHPEDLEGQPHITSLADKMKSGFSPEDWPKHQKNLIAQGIDRTIQDGRVERTDGVLIHYSTVPLPDGGVLITHVNVTDAVQVENALREKNAALEAAEQLKLDFLANVSYQLRTPLNAIMGFTEILSNEYFGSLNDRQRGYTLGMHDAGQRLLGLIDDILDLSTIEAGYMDLNKNNVSIRDILQALHDLTVDWARKEKIEIKLDCPDDIGKISIDERRIKQALLNLVRNAINYTPTGGTITLSAKQVDHHVHLTVQDTGAGIAPADQQRIFEPFERGQSGPDKTGSGPARGAGLGLTLVRNIVKIHGGDVLLESSEGKGASFTVVLPDQTTEHVKKSA